jgi:hypothetical protein
MRPLESNETGSIMSLTAAMSFDVTTGDEGLRTRLADGLAAKGGLTKKTRSGEKAISFDEAVLSSTPMENGMRIMLSVGSEQSIRIDELVSILSGAPLDELWRFSIVKTAQSAFGRGIFRTAVIPRHFQEYRLSGRLQKMNCTARSIPAWRVVLAGSYPYRRGVVVGDVEGVSLADLEVFIPGVNTEAPSERRSGSALSPLSCTRICCRASLPVVVTGVELREQNLDFTVENISAERSRPNARRVAVILHSHADRNVIPGVDLAVRAAIAQAPVPVP